MSLENLSHKLPVLMLVVLFFPPQTAVPAGVIGASARKLAPNFSLRDSSGAVVELSQYKGKVVLVDFWATYCGVCKKEIPWYEQFRNRYKSRGLAVIGVSMDTGWKDVKPFMTKEKMSYPVVIGSWNLLGRFGMHVQALPLTFLIDRDGRIAVQHPGLVNKNQFESEIKKLLTEKGS